MHVTCIALSYFTCNLKDPIDWREGTVVLKVIYVLLNFLTTLCSKNILCMQESLMIFVPRFFTVCTMALRNTHSTGAASFFLSSAGYQSAFYGRHYEWSGYRDRSGCEVIQFVKWARSPRLRIPSEILTWCPHRNTWILEPYEKWDTWIYIILVDNI